MTPVTNIELDAHGHHEKSKQGLLDRKRDATAKRAGWNTYRRRIEDIARPIPSTHFAVKALLGHPYVRRVHQNGTNPLQADSLGKQVLDLVIAPFAVARIQKVLVEAIRGGTLALGASRWQITEHAKSIVALLNASVDQELMRQIE